MLKYAFYRQKYMQRHVKIRTVLAKTCRNIPEISKKYAKMCSCICTNMQNMQFKYAKLCKIYVKT